MLETNFFEENLKKKLNFCQKEHIEILKYFGEVEKELNPLKGFEKFIDITITNVHENKKLPLEVLNICLSDLEVMSLIIMTNRAKYTYYITPLGMKLLNQLDQYRAFDAIILIDDCGQAPSKGT